VISHFGAWPQADLAALVGSRPGGVAAALGSAKPLKLSHAFLWLFPAGAPISLP
jgi:hypothetical protein